MNSDQKIIIKRKKGFTLIELLVVIAIIALLMSILMPTLKLVRRQVRTLICISNQRQCALYFWSYANDNNGRFYEGEINRGKGTNWLNSIRSYHNNNWEIFMCAEVKEKSGFAGSKYEAWGPFTGNWWRNGCYGSCGVNGWLADPPAECRFNYTNKGPIGDTRFNWRNANIKGADKIPILCESIWYIGWAHRSGDVPDYDGAIVGSLSASYMSWYMMNRHNGYVGCNFLDFSGRKVGLKELWELNWSREWYRSSDGDLTPIYAAPTEFTQTDHWLYKYKNYARY